MLKRARRPPAVVFVYGFTGFILVGTLVLTLPVASASGQWTPLLDALFTATSAVCVTGLVVLDTGTYWSQFGQVVILALIQLGGFGFMTSSTLLLLLLRREATLRDRILRANRLGSGGLGSALYLARKVIVFTLIAERSVRGAEPGVLRDTAPPPSDLGGIFHAVSAFNNARIRPVPAGSPAWCHSTSDPTSSSDCAAVDRRAASRTRSSDVGTRRRFVRLRWIRSWYW
jgi:trk system potassium uptake protein TrkH